MEAKNAPKYNDRCGSETERISLQKEISQSFRLVRYYRYYDKEDNREFTFLTNTKQLFGLDAPIFIRKDGWSSCF